MLILEIQIHSVILFIINQLRYPVKVATSRKKYLKTQIWYLQRCQIKKWKLFNGCHTKFQVIFWSILWVMHDILTHHTTFIVHPFQFRYIDCFSSICRDSLHTCSWCPSCSSCMSSATFCTSHLVAEDQSQLPQEKTNTLG